MKATLKECFEVGKTYTLFKISEGMATTNQAVIKVTRFDESGNPIFKVGRERKERILKLETRHYSGQPLKPFNGAIFEGVQPISCDTEHKGTFDRGFACSTFRGNACFNFTDTPEAVRAWIDAHQMNPHFEKARVVATGPLNDQEVVAYPELATGGHAVIERLLERGAA